MGNNETCYDKMGKVELGLFTEWERTEMISSLVFAESKKLVNIKLQNK